MTNFALTRRSVAVACAIAMTVIATAAAHAAVNIREVTSDGGIRAWLVEDYSVPIISIRFSFKSGSTQDPVGKEGLANLMTGLFDEGAGELTSDQFQERLDDAAAEMSFSADRDTVSGTMRMLADTKDEAFELLRLAINKPRFDQMPIDRIRAQLVAGIKAKSRNPDTIAQISWAKAFYGSHPYSRRSEGTEEGLKATTADDLHKFHRSVFSRQFLNIGVVGAIDADSLSKVLDKLFGALPAESELRVVERATPNFDQVVRVDYDLPQATLQFAYPGIEREDPEFFAAYMMNRILGGGTFSSRLYDEIREKRGLAYGVGSYIANRDYSSALVISTSTRADRAEETLEIIRAQVDLMTTDGPTQMELDSAKRFVKGSYAIQNLGSSRAIARTLVGLQEENLGIDYIERRGSLIDAVTLDAVKSAAKRILNAEPAIMVLGPAAKSD